MEELLKKHYKAIKGNIYVVLAGILAIGFYILCHIIPKETGAEAGIMMGYLGMFTLLYVIVTFLMTPRVMIVEGMQQKDKKNYVAAKYTFVAVAYGCILCLSIIIGQISMRTYSEKMDQLTDTLMNIQPMFTGLFLLITAIMIPVYLLKGRKQGTVITVVLAIFMITGALILWLVCNSAGLDISYWQELLSGISQTSILFIVIRIATPCLGIAVYYGSYRLVQNRFEME